MFLGEGRKKRVSSNKSRPGFSPPPPGAHTTHARLSASAEAAVKTAQRSQVACCTSSCRMSISRWGSPFLFQVQSAPGSSCCSAAARSRPAPPGSLRKSAPATRAARPAASRVELMTFAILKNALRSRAMRPTPRHRTAWPERSRVSVLKPAAGPVVSGARRARSSSSGPVRNRYSLLPMRIRSPCSMVLRLTLVPLTEVPL